MKRIYAKLLLVAINLIVINFYVIVYGQTKPIIQSKSTLDSLQGLWVLKIDTTQKILFKKDTMIMYDHNVGSMNKFYLSTNPVKRFEELKKSSEMINGCFLTSVDPDDKTLFKYAIEYLNSKKLIMGYAHKGGPYEYYKAKSNSKH
jgi:hypothetical protein